MVHADEIRVLSTQATEEAYRELVPQFEKASGHKVTTVFTGTLDANKRLAAGETYDLLIMSAPSIDEHIKAGKVVPGSRVDLAKSGVGVGVKGGALKPDISTTEALKKTVLAAKSIGYSTGPSGVYIIGLFQRMGIADRRVCRQHHRQRGGRDRLPAGERIVALRRRRLCRPIAGGHPAVHHVFERHHCRSEDGGRRQGARQVHHRAGGGRRLQEERHGAGLTRRPLACVACAHSVAQRT